MKLTDLEPEFVRWEDRVIPQNKVAPGYDTGTPEGAAAWKAAGKPTVEVGETMIFIINFWILFVTGFDPDPPSTTTERQP